MRYSQIIYDGLWRNNTGLVQLLGLCPLLAVSTSAINGLGMGLATTLVLAACNLAVSLVRHWIPNEVRIPIFVLLIAAIVTAIELLIKAFYYELYMVLGIFIPLIVTNCAVIGRAEAFASKNVPLASLLDGLMIGLGFTFALVLLGGMRELLGHGTLFAQAELMFGQWGKSFSLSFGDNYKGLLLAILPPGAFFCLGLLIAGKNWIDARIAISHPVRFEKPVSSNS